VQGLFYVSTKVYPNGEFEDKFKVEYAWLTGSAAPDYYEHHPEAKKQRTFSLEAYNGIAAFVTRLSATEQEPFQALLANNNPRQTSQCIEYLRKLAKQKTTYVHRGIDLRDTHDTHPFKEVTFEIWAPEEDTTDYYRGLRPMALGDAEPWR